MSIVDEVQQELLKMEDCEYKTFSSNLMPGVDFEKVIGIRIPKLRKYAKELVKREDIDDFLLTLPHKYHEENNIHAFILEQCRDFDKTIGMLNSFLPYVDNWSTCDSMKPKAFKSHKKELWPEIKKWIASEHAYTIRFGIEMLMSFYLDENFDEEQANLVCAIKSDEYYVNMMIAWYFATALAKQWDRIIPYIVEKRMTSWCHNKTIQKARESFRISKEQKEYLNKLKITK
ncbi:MAG: DNA alkylation repair protein [Lachnospiraceae bacterium]|nr:DNA alkylation repair protein [Lachnospiraceae bacterium]